MMIHPTNRFQVREVFIMECMLKKSFYYGRFSAILEGLRHNAFVSTLKFFGLSAIIPRKYTKGYHGNSNHQKRTVTREYWPSNFFLVACVVYSSTHAAAAAYHVEKQAPSVAPMVVNASSESPISLGAGPSASGSAIIIRSEGA